MSRDVKELHVHAGQDAGQPASHAPNGTVTLNSLKKEGISRFLTTRVFRYGKVILHASVPFPKPFLSYLVCRAMSHGSVVLVAEEVGKIPISWFDTIIALKNLVRDRAAMGRVLVEAEADSKPDHGERSQPARLTNSGCALVVSSSLTQRQAVGGMYAHQQGVLGALARQGCDPVFYTTAVKFPPMQGCERRYLVAPNRFWDFPEAPWIVMPNDAAQQIQSEMKDQQPRFVYERHSVYGRAGRLLAREWAVPFVLEYNGSEPWMARNWGGGLRYGELAEKLEARNLAAADLVVAVSTALADDATERGARPETVIVVPNGVDTDRFNPDVSPPKTGDARALGGRTVIGFSGTFGVWHGAELLAEAFVRMVKADPSTVDRLCLLMIGDGQRHDPVVEILKTVPPECYRLTGMVPGNEMPAYLSMCDILVSPQLPDPVTEKFIGSPTKLFEYMAMGKAVVASGVGQMTEIIRNRENGLLFAAGDANDLERLLTELAADASLRKSLGTTARSDAVAKHTWDRHVGTILQHLRDRCGTPLT